MSKSFGPKFVARRGRSAVLVLAAFTLIGTACGSTSASSNGGARTTIVSTNTRTTGSTLAAGPEKLLSRQGTSNATTRIFTVPDNATGWKLDWSYSCSTKPPSIFALVVEIYQGPWRDRHDTAVTEPSTSLSGKGTEHYTDVGDFTLHITSYLTFCSWTIKASST